MKFATKLTVLVITIILIAGFAASYLVYLSNVSILEKQIIGRYKEQSVNTVDKLDRMLFERAADIKVLARSPVFHDKHFTEKDITRQLIEYRNSYKAYITLSFCDMNRTKLADTYRLGIGKQQRLNRCWEEILKGKDSAMDAYVSETLQAPVICLMQVVKNPEGQRIGVINAKIPINKLNDILGELNPDAYKQHIQFDLVDSEGVVVYSNYNKKGVLKDKPADVEVVNYHLAGKEYCFVSRYAGERSFCVVTPERGFLDFKGNNWTLIVRIPLKIALQPAVELRNKMAIISVALGVFLIPVLMVLARLTTRPIVRLRDAAIEIGKGNFGIKLETTSKDEVGQLYDCFNTMSVELKENQDRLMNYGKELESRVSERTKEIYLLQSLAIAVSASRNLQDALVVAIRKICNYTGWIYGEAWMPGQDGTRLERDHAFYSSVEGLEKFSEYSCGVTFTPGSGLPGRAWAEKQPVWIQDVTHDPHYLRSAIAGEVGFRAGIAFPVIADNEVVAVLVFYSVNTEEGNDHLVKLVLSTLSQTGSFIRRKQHEETLERYGILFSEINDLVYLCDTKGNILFVNKVFEKLTGHKPEEFTGKTFAPLFDKKNLEIGMDSYTKSLSGESPEYEVSFKDTGILCEYKNIPWKDTNGNVVGVMGVARDITGRKRMEDQLRKLSSAVEQSSTTIVITDTNGNIQYANPKFTQLTGYTPEEAIGKNPRILKSGKTPPEVYKQLWDAITTGGDWQGEFCNMKKNGDLYWELAHISPLKNSEGVITNFIAFKDDITERKRMESEHEKLREQLYRSQNLASVGKLAGGVAHNFNNLLTVIMGFASLLDTEVGENSHFRDYTQKIIKSSQTAADLTQALLAFSRKLPVIPKPVDINEIIRQSESLLSKLIREDIAFTTVLSRENAVVMADVGQIEQVLMNLVTNARDAMPNGGNLRICTEVIEMEDAFIKRNSYGIEGKYVHVSLSDTGIGMDENTRLRIFEPFFTTKEVGKGTGIGLSSVYGIIKQHNGYINVDSEPGKGATFNIYLPVIESVAAREEREKHAPFPEGGTYTVLLAEDDAVVRELVRLVLERVGYMVIEAVDGEDAIVKFMEHKNSIKLLVSDLIMPKKNGKEVYEAIRKESSGMKVLFITGYDDDAISNIDIHREKFDYLIKPVSPVELLRKVREVLDRGREAGS